MLNFTKLKNNNECIKFKIKKNIKALFEEKLFHKTKFIYFFTLKVSITLR